MSRPMGSTTSWPRSRTAACGSTPTTSTPTRTTGPSPPAARSAPAGTVSDHRPYRQKEKPVHDTLSARPGPRRATTWLLLFAALALCGALLGAAQPSAAADGYHPVPCATNPGPNQSLTRQQIQQRASTWLNLVTYSQSRCYTNANGDYRTDCSGYVAMSWGLSGPGEYWYTGNIRDVTTT